MPTPTTVYITVGPEDAAFACDIIREESEPSTCETKEQSARYCNKDSTICHIAIHPNKDDWKALFGDPINFGDNWAKGYYGIGKNKVDSVISKLKTKTTGFTCNNAIYTIVVSAKRVGNLGFTTLFLEKLREDDEFKECFITAIIPMPSPKMSHLVVEPYTAVLTYGKLVDSVTCNVIWLSDVEAAYDAAFKKDTNVRWSSIDEIQSEQVKEVQHPKTLELFARYAQNGNDDFSGILGNEHHLALLSDDEPGCGLLPDMKEGLETILRNFQNMYRRKAFVHWFTGEGMPEDQFDEAEDAVEEIITDLEECLTTGGAEDDTKEDAGLKSVTTEPVQYPEVPTWLIIIGMCIAIGILRMLR